MKVILLSDVKKQGKKGDIISVKDGYGDYLINNGLAVLETKGSKKVLDQQKSIEKKKEDELLNKAMENKKKIEGLTLNFKVKVGKGEQVFGSVSSKQIASSLKEYGIDVDKRKIEIDGAINSLGISYVTVCLHKKVSAKLKVHLES